MGTAASSSLQPARACGSGSSRGGAPGAADLDPALFVVDTGKARILLNQTCPAVASNGSQCLVVWHDDFSPNDIRGVRVSSTGEVLDRDQIVISTAINKQCFPAVAWGDSVYLVVWQDMRSGTYDIYGARVAADGRVLDPAGIPICTALNIQEYPTVAAGDSSWLVVWEDQRTGINVFGARVSLSGVVLDPAGLPIGVGNRTQTLPKAAWNGNEFLVVWKSDEHGAWTTHGARVAPDGELLDPSGFFIAGDRAVGHSAGHPAVASDGQDFCVAWQNEVEPKSIFASRVSADGTLLGEPVRISFTTDLQELPAIAFHEDRYLICWQRYGSGTLWRDLWGSRFSKEGALLDSTGILLVRETYDQGRPALAATDRGWFAVWFDQRYDTYFRLVFAVGVDTAGRLMGNPDRINPFQAYFSGQYAPAVSAGDTGYLLVWESRDPINSSGRSANICGMRIGPDGTPENILAINIACHPGSELTPAVAQGDTSYLVAYVRGGVCAGLVTESGRALNPYGIQISAAGNAPDVAFGADLFLVVWYRDLAQDEVRAARVTETGVVLDPEGFVVSVGGDTKRDPKVAFDGLNFLVVWQEGQAVKGARVGVDRTVIDPFGFIIRYQASQPDISFDGTSYLVVWTDRSGYRGYGTRVMPSAQIPDTARVQLTWGDWVTYCREPEVAFDGRNYVVTWMDNWSRAGIRGSLVTTDLKVIDSFHVRPPTEWGLSSPCLAFGPHGGVLACAGRTPFGMPWDTLSRIWAAPLGLPVGMHEPDTSVLSRPEPLTARPALFRGSTLIYVGGACESVDVFDAAGRLVRELKAGPEVVWDGCDGRGEDLPPGVYVVTSGAFGARGCLKVVKLE